jgi:hypothetical protein
VQVDADVLCLLLHGSLLSSPGWCGNPKCAPHTWSRATGGGLPWVLRLGCLGSIGLRRVLRCHERSPSVLGRPSRWRFTGPRHAGAALRSFMTSTRRAALPSVLATV